jgi:hypothetical protein
MGLDYETHTPDNIDYVGFVYGFVPDSIDWLWVWVWVRTHSTNPILKIEKKKSLFVAQFGNLNGEKVNKPSRKVETIMSGHKSRALHDKTKTTRNYLKRAKTVKNIAETVQIGKVVVAI